MGGDPRQAGQVILSPHPAPLPAAALAAELDAGQGRPGPEIPLTPHLSQNFARSSRA